MAQEHEQKPQEQEPQIVRKSMWPSGSVPKNRQNYAAAGVFILLMLTIFFSGAGNPTPRPTNAPIDHPPLANTSIETYRQQLKEQETYLKLEQDKLKRASTNWPGLNQQSEQGYRIPGQPVMVNGQPYYPSQQQQEQPAPVDLVEQERKKRDYQSLFASNVALSYRKTKEATAPVEVPPTTGGKGKPEATNQPATTADASRGGHKLFEGTLIEGALTNRLQGQFAGPVNVQVTTDVYSRDGQSLLIPRGTRVLGEAKQVQDTDQQRLAVVFHRLIMPDGFSVSLDETMGLDQAGASALKDKVNHHYLATFGTSIAYGLLAGFSQWGTQGVYSGDGVDMYRQGVATSMGRNGQQSMQRQLNRLPDIEIREGHRVKIVLNKDLTLPAYKDHQPIDGV
jgi:type IV secretory pathway VirB10-like protein